MKNDFGFMETSIIFNLNSKSHQTFDNIVLYFKHFVHEAKCANKDNHIYKNNDGQISHHMSFNSMLPKLYNSAKRYLMKWNKLDHWVSMSSKA